MSGIMSVTGEPDGTPVKMRRADRRLSRSDCSPTNGVLAALIARGKTGRGQHIDTSLFESALAMSVWETTEYWATGRRAARDGLGAPAERAVSGIPHARRTTSRSPRSRRTVANDSVRRSIASALGNDPRFATNAARMANRPALVHEIEAALAARDDGGLG